MLGHLSLQLTKEGQIVETIMEPSTVIQRGEACNLGIYHLHTTLPALPFAANFTGAGNCQPVCPLMVIRYNQKQHAPT